MKPMHLSPLLHSSFRNNNCWPNLENGALVAIDNLLTSIRQTRNESNLGLGYIRVKRGDEMEWDHKEGIAIEYKNDRWMMAVIG